MSERTDVVRVVRPRCFLVIAHAPEGMLPAEANRQFNEFVEDRRLPLVLFHDHFIGRPGGVAIFYVERADERQALAGNTALEAWQVEIRPLIFSYSPAAFDEQIAFTLEKFRGVEWEQLRREERPSYGNRAHEAETAAEDL